MDDEFEKWLIDCKTKADRLNTGSLFGLAVTPEVVFNERVKALQSKINEAILKKYQELKPKLQEQARADEREKCDKEHAEILMSEMKPKLEEKEAIASWLEDRNSPLFRYVYDCRKNMDATQNIKEGSQEYGYRLANNELYTFYAQVAAKLRKEK